MTPHERSDTDSRRAHSMSQKLSPTFEFMPPATRLDLSG